MNVAAIALSGVTGMTTAGVSLLAYIRFQHPEQFADTAVKMSHPEMADEASHKWGVFGTGLADSLVPSNLRDLLVIPDLAQKIENQKKRRQDQIRQTIEDLRPKD